MSNKEIKTTEQKQEKVMTKYDLKMQRRKEQKEQELKEKRRSQILGIVLVVALACLVLSFPIRNYLTVNGSYIKLDGQDISRVEYDYHYNLAKTGYISEYGSILNYYFGIDISQNFDSELYSESMTWGDLFDEMAVDNLTRNKALLKEAQAAGFVHDTTAEYDEYMEALKDAAAEAGMSQKAFIQDMYGVYATEARVKPYIEEGLYTSAYYLKLTEQMTPSQEEIEAYYNNDTAAYDSVDYYVYSVDAVLPTEPAESTDSEEAENTDETSTEGEGTDASDIVEQYEPTEEEIAAAMAEAKAAAEKAVKTIIKDGELMTNVTQSAAIYVLRDWLFDAERKAGDTTVIEDATNSRYYVLQFEKRYLNESNSADIRVITTAGDNAQAILDEWKSGAATEESFAEICDKYNDPTIVAAEGGLFEGLVSSTMDPALREWIFDSARVPGETTIIAPEDDEYTHVLYYVAPNRPEWILSIESTIIDERMVEHMDEIAASMVVEDPKDNLKYPELRAAEEAAAREAAEAQSSEAESSEEESTESSESSTTEE